MRIALGVEYDGSRFSGWQSQTGQRTVQSSLEEALARIACHPVATVCAGRTDAGVHAHGQVVHFDTEAERPDAGWVRGVNSHLPPDLSVSWVRQAVPDPFHARFSALRRTYRYVIFNRPVRPATLHGRVSWFYKPLDAERMQQAAQALLGEHDFTSYRAAYCQAKSPCRRVEQIQVVRHGLFVIIAITANAFLHHMVRNIAGVLTMIGEGERPVEWAGEVLAARDRAQGGITAPPHGLYLERVEYPEAFAIPYLDLPRNGLIW